MSGIEAAMFATLSRDADLKTSKAGKPYLRLNVRVGDGDEATWVSVVSFDPDAIAAADRLVKGCKVYIEGRLTLNQWTAQDGAQRHGLSCLSFHTRLAHIGRNKPHKPKQSANGDADTPNAFHSDPV